MRFITMYRQMYIVIKENGFFSRLTCKYSW